MIVQHTYLITLKNKNWTQIKIKPNCTTNSCFFNHLEKEL